MVQKLPAQIVGGAKRPSFAFHTVTERWPKIVAGIVDRLHQSYNKTVADHGEKAGKDVNSVIAKLSEMRYLIMTDKPLEEFSAESAADAAIWNGEIQKQSQVIGKKVSWFTGPWLFVECYMYRQIYDFLQQTQHLRDYDPFWEDKEKGYNNSSKYLLAMGTELVHLFERRLSPDETRQALLRLLQVSLWGNKCDLSLTGGDPHSMSATIFHELDELRPNILADDLDKAIDQHLTKPMGQVDLVLDNAGLELFMDLCLADFLLAKDLARKVVLHGKAFPWFVSDTVQKDLDWLVQQLSEDQDQFLTELGNRWRKHLAEGTFEFQAHPFWTQSFEYCRMPEKAPELYKQLQQSAFIVFKGDLNYRKLAADREWPWQTPFSEALCGFAPAPLLALRTLKAETVAGLSAEAVSKVDNGKGDRGWMTSSDYAVAQLCTPEEVKKV